MNQTVTASPLTLDTSLDLYPGINRFALDFTRGNAGATRFLCPLDLTSVRPRPRGEVGELARALISTNAAWGNDVSSEVEQWQAGKTVTLVAGQQVGFAGGPLYTLAKLASLLRFREDLRKQGTKATVFFWMATEDHDFDEVATLTLMTRDGLREVRASERSVEQRPVGTMPIPPSLRQQLLSILQTPEPSWLAPGITFGESFARLLVSVLGSGSVVLIDSLLPELRRAGAPVVRKILENYSEMQSAVAERSREIETLGYPPQIAPGPQGEYTFLYRLRDGVRHSVSAAEARELIRIAETEPETISTAALTRPLLQDAVLRPEVFVGGPAEVAYYAQITTLHQKLKIDPPQVALRGHVLVAPARVLRAVERYNLRLEEMFVNADELITKREGETLRQLDSLLQTADTTVEEQLNRIRGFVGAQDPTMLRATDHSLRKMRHQLRRLSDRGRRAIARRDRERHTAITRLLDTLMPKGKPQDRIVAWLSWWLQYGKHFLDRLVSEIQPGSDRLKIVGL